MRPLMLTVVLVFMSAASGTAFAAADSSKNCDGVAYADDLSNLALGVVSAPKVNFISDALEKPACPSAAASCKRKDFLRARNVVVFDPDTAKDPFICVSYIDKRGNESDGWLPGGSVSAIPAPKPNWIGTWKRNSSGEIDITAKPGGKADVSGEATWGSGAATHDGGIGGEIDAAQAIQSFATDYDDKQIAYSAAGQYQCAVIMHQLGSYLFAMDNQNCGGANVSFTGLYSRR